MTTRFLDPARWWCAGGMAAVAVGIMVQILAGVDFPVVPPGLVVTVVAAAVVVLVRRRWAPAVGLLVAVWLIIGLFVSGTTPRLVDPSPAAALAGLWIQVAGLVMAGVAAAAAWWRESRKSREDRDARRVPRA
jgi:hypothetical protein